MSVRNVVQCFLPAICAFLLLGTPDAIAAGQTSRPPTLAEDLLALERTVRDVPGTADETLSQALNEAFRQLGSNPKAPTTPAEAIALSKTISTALAKSNFLQPARREEWVSTLGEALVPHSLSSAELDSLLAFEGNTERSRFIARDKPVFLVDCDIGSLLIISVAARFGWDVRLVEVPDHNFVRWHLPGDRTVNWDWTQWQSREDATYMADTAINAALRTRGIYLRSDEPKEARSYYIGLIGFKARTRQAGTALLERALREGAVDSTTYNNLAWNYVVQPDIARLKSDAAVMYALTAWSMRPEYGNFTDTVACAFAAAGNKALAMALEDYAAAHAESAKLREDFLENRQRIANGAVCQ